jgi:hypothetical protein
LNPPRWYFVKSDNLTSSPRDADAGHKLEGRYLCPIQNSPNAFHSNTETGKGLELRRKEPRAKLAAVQSVLARQYGFSSWRALKSGIEQWEQGEARLFFEACTDGALETLRRLWMAIPV